MTWHIRLYNVVSRPRGPWPLIACWNCDRLLDPAVREAMSSLRGIICSEACDYALLLKQPPEQRGRPEGVGL